MPPPSTISISSISLSSAPMSSAVSGAAKLSVDTFYDNKKNILDICGNFINEERYPFINILSGYLNDIVSSIDVEIKNSARNSMINWREKKNPKLLSRFINNDDNINLINRSMNKITGSNYGMIVAEITDSVIQDNPRRLPDYCKYLFDSIIKKCITDENFIMDYIKFLMGFDGLLAESITGFINQFIYEVGKVLTTNELFKEYIYFDFIKDVTQYKTIGIIYSTLYKVSVSVNPSTLEITKDGIIANLTNTTAILANLLEWLPANIDELNGRLYLFIGITETLCNELWVDLGDVLRGNINDILEKAYAMSAIPNKIKFKILDLQDVIKSIKLPQVVIPVPVPVPVPVAAPTHAPLKVEADQLPAAPVASVAPVAAPVSAWNRNVQRSSVSVPDSVIESSKPTAITERGDNHSERSDRYHNRQSDRHYERDRPHRSRNVDDRPRDQQPRAQSRTQPRISRQTTSGNTSNTSRNDSNSHKEPIIKRGNMFSGLINSDDEPTADTPADDFIVVERKGKNKNKSQK